MLRILQAKVDRAEHAEKMSQLISMRRAEAAPSVSNLLPGPAWRRAAEEMKVPLAHVIAVFNVESAGSGFDKEGRLGKPLKMSASRLASSGAPS